MLSEVVDRLEAMEGVAWEGVAMEDVVWDGVVREDATWEGGGCEESPGVVTRETWRLGTPA